jgi:DNA-binding YbaB/EbfC family protein
VFKGLGNLANLGALLKQAQEMGGRMQSMQEELRGKRATGAAGAGMVEVDVNGLGEVLAVRIDPSLFDRGERELIEDLLPAACNAAQQKARQLHAEAMRSITGGIALPGVEEALAQWTGPESGDTPPSST